MHYQNNNKYDGCGPHRAKNVAAFLDAEDVEVLPWTAQIPDLNSIDYVRAAMKHRLGLYIPILQMRMHYL